MFSTPAPRPMRRHRGFTLTELLVAVVVLLVVILAVGRIFSTTSVVVRTGEASSRVLQEITAIEQLVRKDFSHISSDGFLLVQCVAVRNDVMESLGGGDLLDPSQPADHIIRCDQVAFIADDIAIGSRTSGMAAFTEGGGSTGSLYTGTEPTPQTTTSLIYLGHGYQLPFLPRSLDEPLDPLWPSNGGQVLHPWYRPLPSDASKRIQLQRWPSGATYPGQYNGSQPPVKEWALSRQELLIADDYDGEPDFYMASSFADQNRNAAAEYFDDTMRSSRVEILSSDLARLREVIRNNGPQGVADGVLNYRPRSEKSPPTLKREDVLMASNVLGSNCSSFVVDWTWGEGVGRDLGLDLDPNRKLRGAVRGVSASGGTRPGIGGENEVITEAGVGASPWFGLGNIQPGNVEPILDNYGNPNLDVTTATTILLDDEGDFYDRGMRFYPPIDYDPGCGIFGGQAPPEGLPQGDGSVVLPDGGVIPNGATLFPRVVENIEGADIANLDLESVVDRPFGLEVPIWRYRAFFGLNGDEPFVRDGTRRPVSIISSGGDGQGPRPWPVYRSDYTPWPSALRITATFGDPKGAIEGGRQVQFVIQLPQRVQDLPEG